MTEQHDPVDNTIIVGLLATVEQEIRPDQVITRTHSRALRMPWWILALVVGLPSPWDVLERAAAYLE